MAEKKKKSFQISKLYSKEGNSLKRLSKFCPKCGKGTTMAKHKNRYTCGKCRYTEFQSKTEKKE